MAIGVISSTFDIVATNDGAVGFLIQNPGRAFAINGIKVYATSNTGNVQIARDGFTNFVADQSSVANAWAEFNLDYSNTAFTAAQDIWIDPQATTVTKFVINCIGNPSQSVTIT